MSCFVSAPGAEKLLPLAKLDADVLLLLTRLGVPRRMRTPPGLPLGGRAVIGAVLRRSGGEAPTPPPRAAECGPPPTVGGRTGGCGTRGIRLSMRCIVKQRRREQRKERKKAGAVVVEGIK